MILTTIFILEHNELALALIDPKKEKRVTRYQAEDWNDVDIKSISEINMATMVSAPEKNSQSSEEGSSTPFSKRKEKDQLEQTSTSKKICTKAIKMEKIKDD
ncbi:BnaC03g60900D [Brassica napus]|uniref:BnaC03g60900D protein n=1 Tax=Brassica napus TaxID=3708 RepID=A0A078HM01_BRANA|nr:BnaC03g60900D [Brassica napus]